MKALALTRLPIKGHGQTVELKQTETETEQKLYHPHFLRFSVIKRRRRWLPGFYHFSLSGSHPSAMVESIVGKGDNTCH